jgi:hypothetical protein
MSDKFYFQPKNDEASIAAFLDLLSAGLNGGDLAVELPADVISFAESRDLTSVDVNEVIVGPVEIY